MVSGHLRALSPSAEHTGECWARSEIALRILWVYMCCLNPVGAVMGGSVLK